MMRVKGLTSPQADSVHRIRGLMAPQVAGRRSQVAMDSDAAARRQVYMDDTASGTPRLVEKIVARCSWLVVRKNPPLDKNGLWLNLTAGRPPLLSVLATALHLPRVGTWRTRKALGQPLRTRPLPCVFIISRKRYSIHRLYAIP